MQDLIIIPLGGLSDDSISDGFDLSIETINLYPDEENYLVNYPGRTDLFRRDSPDGAGTPPTLGTSAFTRVHVFKDGKGSVHTLFVRADTLCVQHSNGYRILYKFKGRKIDDKCYPDIFTHQGTCVILNPGDIPLIWDGQREVCPLGVTETPSVPIVHPHEDPMIRTSEDAWGSILTSYWWPGEPPVNGLSNYGEGDIAGLYEVKVVFVDRYGNRGPASPASPLFEVAIDEDVDFGEETEENHAITWALTQWRSPHVDWHLDGVEVYRTLCQDPTLGNDTSTFYREWNQADVTQQRFTHIMSDADLVSNPVLDDGIIPCPTSGLGCSFGQRIWVRDYYNQETVRYGDIEAFGQFRTTSFYKTKDKIESFHPMGDRLLIVTLSTVEILYTTANGSIRLLEIHDNKGTYFGRSFATYRNNVIGLFHDGFYMFNAQDFKKIKAPYWIQKDYIDKFNDIQTSIVRDEWYYMAARREYSSELSNVIIMLHIPTERWYVIKEQVNDMALYNDRIIGGDNSLYFLFDGSSFPLSKLHIRGLTPKGMRPNKSRVLQDYTLLVDPQSSSTAVIKVSGDDEYDINSGDIRMYPTKKPGGRKSNQRDSSYNFFDRANLNWEDQPTWVGPAEFWLQGEIPKSQASSRHSIITEFPIGYPVRVRAMGLRVSGESVVDKR